ncbi:MAG: hypothetical protein NVS1B9_13500 [Solirubrobacteraceae bacterium]
MRKSTCVLGIQALDAAGPQFDVDPERLRRAALARKPLRDAVMKSRWCSTMWPTPIAAEVLGLELSDYGQLLNGAMLLDQPDPTDAWNRLSAFGARLIKRLAAANELHIEAPGTDLRLKVGKRHWINSDGRRQMPSGEVFTSPIENSATGTVRFTLPSSPPGLMVEDVELEFIAGEVMRARAGSGEEYLQRTLDADAGARRLGEIGIGTNFGLLRPTGMILLDQKLGGTVHLALGRSNPETGGRNASGVHWNMVCDLRGGRLSADGEILMDHGRFRANCARPPRGARSRGCPMRRTTIGATIGPASREPELLEALIRAGMDVARLNYSHGSPDEHAETVRRVRAAAQRAGRAVAILQDLPGPKLRIGSLAEDVVDLKVGDVVTFDGRADEPGTERRMSVSWLDMSSSLDVGEHLYLADGSVRLKVSATRPDRGELDAEVEVGGTVASRQGLNIPGPVNALPAVPDEDLDLLRHGEKIGVDLVALSFVRSAQDVQSVREHTRLPLIAKIEKPQAVDNMEEILRASDAIMVARGDLGIELDIARVPIIQKELLALAGKLARPSITATQMLDSMVASSRPTRAEVADVANAILDGTDALMLSQETAVGAYPVETVQMRARIAEYTERSVEYRNWNENRVRRDNRDPDYTVAYSACVAARELSLDALVVPTLSGRSARLVSAHRPTVPIYALSPGRETVQRCGLMWGVQAASMRRHQVTEELIRDCAARVLELGWCEKGQRIGITAGLPSGRPGSTSLLQIQQL